MFAVWSAAGEGELNPVLFNIGNSILCSECGLALYVKIDDVRSGFVTHGAYDGLKCSGIGKRFKFIGCAEMEDEIESQASGVD